MIRPNSLRRKRKNRVRQIGFPSQKLVGEAEGEVGFGATHLEEEEMTEKEEDLNVGNIGGYRTASNDGDKENEDWDVDPDALRKKKGKRLV